MRIAAERVFALGPLSNEEAAELFVERARARFAEFVPDEDEWAAIHETCGPLDGMPLAIELAAARVGALGPRGLAERVRHPLEILTRGNRDLPERQRSLRGAISWTYALLEPSE